MHTGTREEWEETFPSRPRPVGQPSRGKESAAVREDLADGGKMDSVPPLLILPEPHDRESMSELSSQLDPVSGSGSGSSFGGEASTTQTSSITTTSEGDMDLPPPLKQASLGDAQLVRNCVLACRKHCASECDYSHRKHSGRVQASFPPRPCSSPPAPPSACRRPS